VRGDRAILMVRGRRSPRGPSRRGARRSDKASDQFGDFIRRVQCEMTGVEKVNLSVRHIVAIGLRREIEREVLLAPDHQQERLLLAHPCLPLGVILHVRAVAVEEIALNVALARLLEKIKFIGPEIRVIAFDVGIVADMADFTLSGQRGTARGRSSCARKPRPLFRADRFQSWDARRLVRRSLMCPLRQLGFRRPSLEDCDFR